jgi:hypothetical protein
MMNQNTPITQNSPGSEIAQSAQAPENLQGGEPASGEPGGALQR